ncbi:hypothetical protein BJY00DRAFT_283468 [Aspergillus carlsbadensis]|nr:hypothetical protein BJY00DRAFT_283468 [Aspergillus carlsbadensis]
MSHIIQLGERNFSSSSSALDLELTIRASATISSSDSSNLPCDKGHLKELLCSSSVWVSQAPGLEMNLTIACTPGLHDSIAHFESQLGDAICEAKIWSELGLSALYKSCIQTSDQVPPEIKLSFGIQRRLDSTEAATKCRVPKVLRNLGDFLPPHRVPAAYITSVDILLYYDHKSHRDRTSAPCSTIPEDLRGFEDILQLPEFEDLNSDGATLSPGSISSATESRDIIIDKNLREMDEGQKPDSFSPLGAVSSSELSKLFQDGFRTLILGHVGRRRRDNSPRTESFQGLSRIAPTVFKPQYLEAMNQRARLIPSIAKCMASLLKLSNNRSLQERLAYIKEQARTDNQTSISSNIDDMKAFLKETLWRIAQKQLYNTPTPKPLSHQRLFLEMGLDRLDKNKDMLLEESMEGAEDLSNAYDYYNDCRLGTDSLQIAGDEPFELEVGGAGSCGSSMIFGNSQTEQSVAMSDSYPDAGMDQEAAEARATVFAPRPSRLILPESFEAGEVDEFDGDMIMQGYTEEELLSQALRSRTLAEGLDGENCDCEMLLDETMEDYL